jgi:hypothetical protein
VPVPGGARQTTGWCRSTPNALRALGSKKKHLRFTAEEGGAEHCQVDTGNTASTTSATGTKNM